jgi:hypothetical protein
MIFKYIPVIFMVLPIIHPIDVLAERYYPSRLSSRLLGTSQGRVTDCEAEADVNSIEQAFAIRGFPVRLSLFYRHAFNKRSSYSQISSDSLDLNPEDQRMMDRIGGILPEYMWPEDGRGYPEVTSRRPHPSRSIAFDSEFPNAEQFGFRTEWKTLSSGFLNSIDLGRFKGLISSGAALTLSLHGILFDAKGAEWTLNPLTGLLEGKYSLSSLQTVLGVKSLIDGINHSVQVVGFDDQLYADGTYPTPGAILIRNSWNSDDRNHDILFSNPNFQTTQELRKFRLKLHSTNLPGFYAIPIQYLVDMMSLNISNIKVISIDYYSYTETYLRIKQRYQIIYAPFVCEQKNPFEQDAYIEAPIRRSIANYREWIKTYRDPQSTPAQISNVRRQIRDLAQELAESRYIPWVPKHLNYATLSRNLTSDRVDDFYRGAFNSYYCNGNADSRIWPSLHTSKTSLFQTALKELSLDVGNWHLWNKMLFALEEVGADRSLQ